MFSFNMTYQIYLPKYFIGVNNERIIYFVNKKVQTLVIEEVQNHNSRAVINRVALKV